MRHRFALILLAALACLISGCSKSIDDQFFEAAKCRKASLKIDDLAFREGTEREMQRIGQSLDENAKAHLARYTMVVAQRVNDELSPSGIQNPQITAIKLNEWYRSSYCQSLRSR